MALIRRDAIASAAGKGTRGIIPAELQPYTNIVEFLTQEQWENGDRRETGTFNVFYKDGVVCVCVNDRDANKQAYKTLGEDDEVLAVVNEMVADPGLRWTPGRAPAKKK